jgi:steroid 5-alpha reductase family enzyme
MCRRVDAMWSFYALCMAFVLAAIIAVLIDCQWLASFATGALLVLVVLYGIMVVVFAAVMKVGSDGCAQCQPKRLGICQRWNVRCSSQSDYDYEQCFWMPDGCKRQVSDTVQLPMSMFDCSRCQV